MYLNLRFNECFKGRSCLVATIFDKVTLLNLNLFRNNFRSESKALLKSVEKIVEGFSKVKEISSSMEEMTANIQ
jgi:hypothetical protein